MRGRSDRSNAPGRCPRSSVGSGSAPSLGGTLRPKRLVVAMVLVAAALVPAAGPAAGQVAALAISIDDDGPFAPGVAITATISGAAGEEFAQIEQCNVEGTACAFSAFVELDTAGSASVVLHVRRYVAGEVGVVDCAACAVRVGRDHVQRW